MPALVPKASVANEGSRRRLVEALLQRAKDRNINVEYTDEAKQYGGGAFDRDTGGVKIDPSLKGDHNTLAHELGHAEFDRSMLGRLVQSPMARAMSGLSIPIGALIALTAEGNLARRITMSAGAVVAGQVPLLTGEGVAWYKGHKMLKEHGATPEELAHTRSEAARLGGTYLQHAGSQAASGVGGSMLLSALSHAVNP